MTAEQKLKVVQTFIDSQKLIVKLRNSTIRIDGALRQAAEAYSVAQVDPGLKFPDGTAAGARVLTQLATIAEIAPILAAEAAKIPEALAEFEAVAALLQSELNK